MRNRMVGVVVLLGVSSTVLAQGVVAIDGNFRNQVNGVDDIETFEIDAATNLAPFPAFPLDEGFTFGVQGFSPDRVGARVVIDPFIQSAQAVGFLRVSSASASNQLSQSGFPSIRQSGGVTALARFTDSFVVDGVLSCQRTANGWDTYVARMTLRVSLSTTANRVVQANADLTQGSSQHFLAYRQSCGGNPINVLGGQVSNSSAGLVQNCSPFSCEYVGQEIVVDVPGGSPFSSNWCTEWTASSSSGSSAFPAGGSTEGFAEMSTDFDISVVRTELWGGPSGGPYTRVRGHLRSAAGYTYLNFSPICDSIDFNNNGIFPEDQDITDFLSVIQGGPCSTSGSGCGCSDTDFNNDGVFPDDADIADFLGAIAGSPCP
jgi:hypothetical protein